mmetsp:Transcript_15405/g.49230  ORF Transcript_15405/g.49230 Transcript_15405/m.49230 type:complete len:212 (-) Transcript_15405:21-656(-)
MADSTAPSGCSPLHSSRAAAPPSAGKPAAVGAASASRSQLSTASRRFAAISAACSSLRPSSPPAAGRRVAANSAWTSFHRCCRSRWRARSASWIELAAPSASLNSRTAPSSAAGVGRTRFPSLRSQRAPPWRRTSSSGSASSTARATPPPAKAAASRAASRSMQHFLPIAKAQTPFGPKLTRVERAMGRGPAADGWRLCVKEDGMRASGAR